MSLYDEVYGREPSQPVSSSQRGAGLGLSGGGFRAMLFHVGALRRLFEADALRDLSRITSVSGGSITAAQLALHWDTLTAHPGDLTRWKALVEAPLFEFAGKRLDALAIGAGWVRPRRGAADGVADAYDKLFGGATLQSLPTDPRFVILATNLGTGSLVRFAAKYTADQRVGRNQGLDIRLADAVAASSAFPPILSPKVIRLADQEALTDSFPGDQPPLQRKPWTHRLELTDGGVYDNLGLQPLEKYHTILASDGGGPFAFKERVAKNYLQHMIRAWVVTDNQVRSLRRSNLVSEYRVDTRLGTYWGINTQIAKYSKQRIDVDPSWIEELSSVPTRLWHMPERVRRRLINWGYAVCDAAFRSYVDSNLPDPAGLPYPGDPLSAPVPEQSLWRRILRLDPA
ncbi:MAG: patatin-like phospholipase family protein [Pseudomonadota bacterium]